jgi:hypothetical protein
MKSHVQSLPEHEDVTPFPAVEEKVNRDAILRELDNILASHFFRSAGRSRQFLQYVIQHKLGGHPEQLKERTIGTEVFLRPLGYATGDDPVVRVQAGEVRRRLEQYYQTDPVDSLVRIELPVGSYSPVFHWKSDVPSEDTPPIHLPLHEQKSSQKKRRIWPYTVTALGLVFALAAGIAFLTIQQSAHQKSTLEQFWAPIFSTKQPVLICLAKPLAYRPTEEVYRRYSRSHPGTFETEAERANQLLPLPPDEKLTWGDMFVYSDFGVAAGDVYAAVNISVLLSKLDKPSQLRIGTNYTFEDLRNSPAVVVGGFNNKWTMQLTSNLPFAFVENDEQYTINERGTGGRVWKTHKGQHAETTEDYGIVSRLLDSNTGQFTITVAGIGPEGSQAAGDFVSNKQYLEEGLRSAPVNWQKGNVEVVLRTMVTDSIAGPPRVVAAYYW